MLIELQCRNFSNFDPASGKYVQCGEKIIVPNDQIGQFVSCPKCNQPVEVIALTESQTLERAKKRSQAKSNARSQNKAQSAAGTGRTKSKSGRSKSRRPATTQTAAPDDELRLAAPLKRDKEDVMALDFSDEQIESTLNEDQHDRCSKCGNISKAGKCTVCRHVEQSFKKRHQPLEDVKIELVGFQRWFCSTMSEGVSITFLEYGAHIGLGFIAAGTTLLSIMSLFGLAFGVFSGLILLFLTICAALFYIGLIYKGRQFRKDPRARLAWFQKPFWNAVLLISRGMNWQHYDSNLKGRRITKIRDNMFGDVELANVEGLKNCQVLDLQGTRVTDASIQMLYGHKHLRCLVVKGTNVTHEAVFRFQQSHPKLWIWE